MKYPPDIRRIYQKYVFDVEDDTDIITEESRTRINLFAKEKMYQHCKMKKNFEKPSKNVIFSISSAWSVEIIAFRGKLRREETLFSQNNEGEKCENLLAQKKTKKRTKKLKFVIFFSPPGMQSALLYFSKKTSLLL